MWPAPGFINLTLKPAAWTDALHAVLAPAPVMGAAISARASRSMSNTSPPIRPGRCMSAIAAARCSATRSPTCSPFAGFAVTREYYINDAGAQVDVLARSAYLRYREALGEDIGAIPEGLYPGDYLKRSARRSPARMAARSCRSPKASGSLSSAQGDRHDDGRSGRILPRSMSGTIFFSPSAR